MTSKRKLTQKMLLVSVWWASAGVVHYSFLKSGQTITADVYCQQLQTITLLAAKQPIDWSIPLRHCCFMTTLNTHTARQTAIKLEELQLECLRYPPYSPDLAPTGFLQRKKFNSNGVSPNRLQRFY